MIDVSNQIVLITGGSRGIGAATAMLFAQAGANIAITYQTNKMAAEEVERTVKNLGRKCLLLKGKIELYSDCERIVQQTLEKFKRIDVLVNSAGIWEMGKIGAMSPEQWKRTIDVNLTGTFNLCNLVVPIMKKQKYGKIINVSSTAGQRGEANYSHYAASKGGMIAFTKSIAVELIRNGIWVNCVAPGWVDTDMVSHVFKNSNQKEGIFDSIPRGRIASPEEIAGPILFLASDLSNHIIGEVLNVNGGSVLCG
ncbi:MAG: SDR family oxidoreductase [Ignavibacteriae bacterium]|nr:SDR family oxidoreductase [Ignavibacteriota bacterium]